MTTPQGWVRCNRGVGAGTGEVWGEEGRWGMEHGNQRGEPDTSGTSVVGTCFSSLLYLLLHSPARRRLKRFQRKSRKMFLDRSNDNCTSTVSKNRSIRWNSTTLEIPTHNYLWVGWDEYLVFSQCQ